MVIIMSEKNIGKLEEEALKRKERLKNLKRKKEGNDEDNTKPHGEQISLPKPKFRSYKPEHEELKEHALPETKPGDVLSEVKDQLDAAKAEVVIDELDITNLAPRKPDWDLKRDVAKKLEKLEKRTQKAIAELIRDRLRSQKELAIQNVGPEI